MSLRGRVHSRRCLLIGALRWATLGLLGGLVAGSVARHRRLAERGICANQGLCGTCSIRTQCPLPLARQMSTGAKGE